MLAMCAHAGAAFGGQYYVDGATGSDANTCLQPLVGIPPAGPCDTIDQALALAQGYPGADEVLVADGTYAESLGVGGGTLLRSLDDTARSP